MLMICADLGATETVPVPYGSAQSILIPPVLRPSTGGLPCELSILEVTGFPPPEHADSMMMKMSVFISKASLVLVIICTSHKGGAVTRAGIVPNSGL